ncbi:hypothetical protein HL667_33720 [Bradyrhizobium sp. 83012]|uniref:Uncharacterized protein n=1 Tax=Bradyrhizobium aeschynomenes TaxID=2734909 RepID=A0ABX2CP77_9BRAD|nr:hypothetical protein [Bradyrhizobium aeschynomenes]NPU69991.1 hypothetical protein [Bradyrhizobium aeschynomenes]
MTANALWKTIEEGVSEQLNERAGSWQSCSGCHELNEGHDTGPYSDVFKCALGLGCHECGGIGAVWDATDYEALVVAAERSRNMDPDELDYDHPRFNQGVQHVIDLLSRTIGAEGWVAGDGSEDYDCDLQQTLLNILAARGLYDSDTGEYLSAARARRVAIEECMEKIGSLRQSEAGLFDPAHSGQRGEDRSTALYDAYHLLRNLASADDQRQSSDGSLASGMQMEATGGAITRRPAHPMDTISGGPLGPSEPLAEIVAALEAARAYCSSYETVRGAAVVRQIDAALGKAKQRA